jgi:DNA adenine methylase
MELEGDGYNPVISREGGKFRLYKKVIESFPDDYTDMIYVEPFVGGGSVFFNTEETKKKVINDLDTQVISAYREVKKDASKLQRTINGHYTEEDFKKIKKANPTTQFGKVVKYIVCQKLSYLGSGHSYSGKSNINVDLSYHHEVLKHTTILNEDYKKVIEEYDSPETFFYLDPPYEGSDKSVKDYDNINLQEMVDILSNIKGLFLVSINNSANIRRMFNKFYITKVKTQYALKPRPIVELLISNYKR